MDDVSILVSIIALISSVITWIKSNSLNKKINSINLESEIYMDIFKEVLVKKLPDARDELFVNHQTGNVIYENLTSELINLKKKSKYFCYRNIKFYNELKLRIDKIEEMLVKTEGKVYKGRDESDFLEKIDKELEDLYDFVLNEYFGNL